MQTPLARRHHAWRTVISSASMGVLALSLTACQTEPGSQDETESLAATSGEPESSADESSPQGASQIVSFNERFTFADGIAIQLVAPKPVEGMTTDDGTQPVKMDIAIENEGDTEFKTSDITLTITSMGQMAKMLGYTTAEPLELPYSPISPGQSNTITIGFTVVDPDDMRVIMQFADGRGSVTFVR